MADAWDWRPSGTNPCRGVSRFKVEKHERFLTREELYRLGQALRAAPAERLASTHAAAAIRLLVLTGCRRNEILGLRWDDLSVLIIIKSNSYIHMASCETADQNTD